MRREVEAKKRESFSYNYTERALYTAKTFFIKRIKSFYVSTSNRIAQCFLFYYDTAEKSFHLISC